MRFLRQDLRFREPPPIRTSHRRFARNHASIVTRALEPGKFIRIAPAALPVRAARGGVRTQAFSAFPHADSFARMTKPIAYIETTIPNFYYDLRESEAVTSRRTWTRAWWESAAEGCELITGAEVFLELSAGTSRLVPLRLELLRGLPVLQITPEVSSTAETYIRNKLMPGRPSGDAFHLALASHHGCELIVTWNIRHLANPNKFAHVRHINQQLGLTVPEIVTPLDLLGRMR
jgi:predicted nucleic acid-binding protein